MLQTTDMYGNPKTIRTAEEINARVKEIMEHDQCINPEACARREKGCTGACQLYTNNEDLL